MPLAGEGERLPHLLQLHRLDGVVGMLGDDREQVGQQLALVHEQLVLGGERLGGGAALADVRVEADPDAARGRSDRPGG